MSRQLNDIIQFEKQINEIESDPAFPSEVRNNPHYDYDTVKAKVLATLTGGDGFDPIEVHQDIEYLRSFIYVI